MAEQKGARKEAKEHHSVHKKTHEAAAKETAHPVHHSESKKGKGIRITLPEIRGVNLSAVTTVAAVALLVIVVFQAAQAFTLSQKLDVMAAEAQELSKPPLIEITSVSVDCAECTLVEAVINTIETARVNVTKTVALESSDAEAKQLITKYGIERLPTVIVTGEVDKVSLAGFSKVGDALVYLQTPPPYVDAATNEIKGLVSLTYVNVSSCKECPDLMQVVQQLRSQITVKSFTVVDKDSEQGRKLVEEYEMARLPGILVSTEVKEYPIGAQLAQVGTVKKAGAIALGANPPYLNVSTGKVAGIVQLILLNDSSCTGCYDVTMHIPIVRRFQVSPATIKVIDSASAEGKALVSRYKITAVPTLLVTGDVSPYEQLLAIWPTVGTTEKDGALVFRTMSAIAGRPYKDLTTGKVEQNLPQQAQQQ